ncbi:beta-1,3-glucanase family protein [Eubacterium ventriosum]|uniref:beta-1,3-glucanase family protein n=2 Tax=Eubacterium ventriosum TaxID=39496 RepID=UPI002670D652|nr:beta-1,3-glucanase family protein [Eubacterium ventriosum]
MNKMKRILTIVLTLALIVTMMPMNLTNVNAKSTTRLSSKKIVLQVGKTKKLKVKNKPAGVKVVWKSSKKKVATVSKKGKVKAKKPGKTTITAKVGKKKYKCKVIVKRKNSIKVTKPSDNNNSVINQVTTKSEPSQIVTTKAEVKTTKTETTKKNDSTTVKPTVAPTAKPTVAPTTVAPTAKPTVAPTLKPTVKPTTVAPTTVAPTAKPTVAPTLKPTAKPTTVAPTTANGNVDESIKAPEGLVHAPGEGLPYHFAWAAVDGADGYNVYIDGVYVTKVTENVADLDASMFTKGAGEYTVGVATVKENKTSAITSIKYTYAGSGQPATTKVSVTTPVAPVTTTVAPVATTVAPVTTPSVPGQDVDESIKAPEGLVWAGNANLPYYFAWAKAVDIDSYNVYVDGTLVANVVDGSVNLNESVFTKGSGEYAIGIAAVKGNKTSVITSIKYTYAGSGQPATTKAPEPSTAKPTDVTVAPTAKPTVAPTTVAPTTVAPTLKPTAKPTTVAPTTANGNVDESIKAPEGLVWAGNANLPYYFAWAKADGIDSYNVYVDGTLVANVVDGSVNLNESVFTKGSGEYAIGIAAVKGNKTSVITSIKYTYAGSGQPATTKAPEPSTAKPTDVTVAPTAPGQDVDESIKAPEGLVWAGNADLPYYFAWAPVVDVDSYNVYVDGVYATNVNGNSVNLEKSVFTKGSGEYTVGVAAVKGNKVSNITSIKYTYTGDGAITTTKAPEAQPTAAPTTVAPTAKPTVAPTTAKPTTIPKETTNISFTTDSSIEKPFGLDVSQASVGYVNVVWGRGTIDCYNVYVDGERRRTGISAQALKLPVYTEGTHTIAITTVVGKRESERLEAQIQITGTGEKETEPETCPEELKPQLKENVPLRDDRIAIELNNKTNGKYSDSEIYWCIVGNNANNQLCYMDKDGNMIPASESLNTVEVNGTKYANIYHTLAESDHVYAPTIRSGRMYLSYGKPVYVKFVGSTGYAGPDLNNPGDVNANTLFEFAEFTIEGKHYWGNTTRVDYFCFPMVTRLIGGSLYGGYDNVVGDVGTRDEIFNAFKNEVPNEYKSLVRDDRIIAPCKSTFNVGKINGNYFDNYINEFWNKYANEDLRFSSESGRFVGRVVGNQMRFTREGDSTVYYVDKPNTQEVLEGKGAFDRGNGVEKAIEAQLCAAFNRGVATEPENWYTPSKYYKNSVSNFYAGFFHEHSVLGKAYGFCYDDVNDQSTLLQYDKADALVIDLKW